MHKQQRVTLYGMDCRDAMGLFMAENSVDSIVTDPPYGLGFMGKEWDHGVPGVEFWKHAYDVLKPGGHLLAFSGSRTYHRMVCAIEDAGFEVRDQIMWVYGSGFPKSLDVSKAIDKAAGAADTNQQWQGWGTALKPAHEPICVARKPLIGTVAANVLHWGTGALNIDACRVATGDKLGGGNTSADVDRTGKNEGWQRPWMNDADAAKAAAERSAASVARSEELGRWPANLIHDGSDEVLAAFPVTKSGGAPTAGDRTGDVYGEYAARSLTNHGASEGSAARFFYCAKASKKDRDEGMDAAPDLVLAMSNQAKAELARGNMHEGDSGINSAKVRKNNHPTVKPTDLMAYLCRLVTPPGGVILDPFMGSGSTGKAALREGFRFIGCELDEGYMTIATARLAAETGGAL